MADVVMYSTASCPFCTMAKRLLDRKNVVYQEIAVRDAEMWAEMEVKSGRNTVPQIFIGDYHVGGFDDLSAADQSGQLDQLLAN